ncbi:HAD-IB family hydrolase [Xenorhabdus bovienii]|uniref:HAD family hydrolase n=1 Tax=Xenorhabdus bovienii TaxID=40576 RepID=UPI0023B20DD1|nr:HAD-IB family hydrolase [Xenorhabdus bovienii]MDE9555325.1 HAD-IB family hydrolase [Xenorhabdus bovienii]
MTLTAAFFDVDETLIKMKSMFHFYQFWCQSRQTMDEYQLFDRTFSSARKNDMAREELNRMYYRQFTGVDIDELYQAGEAWFKMFLTSDEAYITPVIDAYQRHKLNGNLTIFISGSMLPLLTPIGKHLNVDAILCTKLLLDERGKLTGEIGDPQTIGEGKKQAMQSFAQHMHVDLRKSFAYGDDLSDIPMLAATGHPICAGGYTTLADYARQNKWEILAESIHIN